MVENQKSLADRLFPIVPPEEEIELKNIPPEQRRLHTETSDLTVSVLQQYMTHSKIDIPEFQRGYVWNRTQASRLIESLIIQCPIPVVYFSQNPDNTLSVIDGNQRLLSIKLFLNDAFPLQGLTTYPELNDYSWSTLDPRFRDHINNRTIRCVTILKDTHPQIKFDVFERLNTGSVKLNAQELRHGLNHGTLIKAIDERARNKKYAAITGTKNDKRMKGAELILRYFSFRYDRATYAKPLTSFLDQFSTKNKNLDAMTVQAWGKEFDEVIDVVDYALGRLAFRIFDKNLKSSSSFNSALYDAEMIGFSETSNTILRRKQFNPETFQRELANLFEEERFLNSIKQATSDEQSVRYRIEAFIAFLNKYHEL